MKKLIYIDEIAAKFNISKATVNYYTNIGLIIVCQKNKNKRLYDRQGYGKADKHHSGKCQKARHPFQQLFSAGLEPDKQPIADQAVYEQEEQIPQVHAHIGKIARTGQADSRIDTGKVSRQIGKERSRKAAVGHSFQVYLQGAMADRGDKHREK